jgi:hypothetical protein
MSDTKFTANALLLVVAVFSAILFFFSIRVVDVSQHEAVNDYYPIEGTDLGVRYSNLKPHGLYRGGSANGVLVLEGDFGYDWGAAAEGESLYLNEYTSTDVGVMLCRLVRVDLTTDTKEILLRDTILRGRCASGELVCLGGYLMPADFPATNPLCRLYAMSSPSIRAEGAGATVLFLDPKTGETVWSVRDEEALTDVFESRYLDRTLQEVMG